MKTTLAALLMVLALLLMGCQSEDQRWSDYELRVVSEGVDQFDFYRKFSKIIIDDPDDTLITGFNNDMLPESSDFKVSDLMAYMLKYHYVSDRDQYGVSDQYAILSDERLGGDCEDEAFTMVDWLLKAGVPVDDIEIVFGCIYDSENKFKGGHTWINVQYGVSKITLTNRGYYVPDSFVKKYWKAKTIVQFKTKDIK